MNPKDMNQPYLRQLSKDLAYIATYMDRVCFVRTAEECRLAAKECTAYADEADALRKENAELRKDAERYRFIRDNADTIAINSSLQYCDIFRSEGIEDGLDIAMKFESDYAAKAKESEASHE